MEYALISFSGSRELFLRNIIISLAQFRLKDDSASGYPVNVGEGLKETLVYIPSDQDHPGKCSGISLLRIYAPLIGDRNSIFIAGEKLQQWVKMFAFSDAIDSSLTFIHISSECPSDRDWGLVSIILPGWVLLFDEDIDHIYRDSLDQNTRVAYCPADEEDLETISPDLQVKDVVNMVIPMILKYLPWRSQEDQ